MSRLVVVHRTDDEGLDRLRRPRTDLVLEEPAGPDTWRALEGPVLEYERTLDAVRDGEGWVVQETYRFRLAVPWWGWLFGPAFRRSLRRRHEHQPWWAPPVRLDARAAHVLGLLGMASVVAGYLGSLLSQTITFAAGDFGADRAAQGTVLAAVRVGVVVALLLAGLADRRGRRTALVLSGAAAAGLGAATALAGDLVTFGAIQTLARGASMAMAITIGIVAAEEMPAGARAYAASVLAMAGALGAGGVVLALPVADLGPGGWRWLYALGLLGVFGIVDLHRRLPESRRFEGAGTAGHGPAGHEPGPSGRWGATERRRLGLLALSGLLVSLFTAPASQFLNEFLRTERGFSAARISLFTIATNTPGGVGIVAGGRLADVRGRRLVGAVGLVGGTLATVAMYATVGWPLWGWSVVGAVLGAATVPALGVYGPELFPTGLRGRANGLITVSAVVGSALGLLVAGLVADATGSLTWAMALLAVGPAALAVLVLVAYPETAMVELEDLNPVDRVGPPEPTTRPAGPGPPPEPPGERT